MPVRALRTTAIGALTVAALALSATCADAQNICRTTDAAGNVRYFDCPPQSPDQIRERSAPDPEPQAVPPSAPAPRVAEPSPRVTDPAPRATEPGPRATEPNARVTAPGSRATEPSAPVTAPGSRATQPSAPVTEPAPRATAPGARVAAPGSRGTEPSTRVTEPGPRAPEPPRPVVSVPPISLPSMSIMTLRPSAGGRTHHYVLAGVPLIVIGIILNLVSTVQWMVAAFGVSVWWGLGCMFVGPVNLVFLVRYWVLVKKPFLLSLGGTALIVVGVVLVKGF